MKEKYTSNFIQPEKPGWHSGGRLPVVEDSDDGKVVAVEHKKYVLASGGEVLPTYDGTVVYLTDEDDDEK